MSFFSPVGKTALSLVKQDVVGCEFCYWVFGFFPQGRAFDLNANSHPQKGGWTFELTCVYDHRDRHNSQKCVSYINGAQARMNAMAEREGKELGQYYNTPTCPSENAPGKVRPFHER